MSIAYIAGFINYTYQIVLVIGKQMNSGFGIWANDYGGIADVIKYSQAIITRCLMSICLLYNLARWYILIQQMKFNLVISDKFYQTVHILTIILATMGIL